MDNPDHDKAWSEFAAYCTRSLVDKVYDARFGDVKLPGSFELHLVKRTQNDMLELAKAGDKFGIHFVNYIAKCAEKLKTQGE